MIHTLLVVPGDATKRRCYDCRHCQGALSWWCVNDEAAKRRGTRIPGERDCPQWESAETVGEVGFWRSMFRRYIVIDNRETIELEESHA